LTHAHTAARSRRATGGPPPCAASTRSRRLRALCLEAAEGLRRPARPRSRAPKRSRSQWRVALLRRPAAHVVHVEARLVGACGAHSQRLRGVFLRGTMTRGPRGARALPVRHRKVHWRCTADRFAEGPQATSFVRPAGGRPPSAARSWPRYCCPRPQRPAASCDSQPQNRAAAAREARAGCQHQYDETEQACATPSVINLVSPDLVPPSPPPSGAQANPIGY
jgi:hypothetical protein